MKPEIFLHAGADHARTVAQFHGQARRGIRVRGSDEGDGCSEKNESPNAQAVTPKSSHVSSLRRSRFIVKKNLFQVGGI
jgi:hypothetical protein